jgi:carboxyl-terminal processing protease
MRASRLVSHLAIVTIIAGFATLDAKAQSLSIKRKEAEHILDEVADDVAKHYYDPTLHGVDWDGQRLAAKKKIENATSSNLAFANLAAMLDSLNDSHTFFIPPPRSFSLDYGWRIQSIGERCLVTRVRPQTDAANKIHPGDEVLAINDYKPARGNIFRIEYVLDALRPQSKIEAVVRSPNGEERKVEIVPKVFEGQLVSPTLGDLRLAGEVQHERFRPRIISLDSNVLVVNIPVFLFDEDEVGKLISAARKHQWVILDLRGNPGGTVESLSLLTSGFFAKEVKIADAVARNSTKPLLAKPDRRTFSGRLIVLVDSRSTSAAELFARVVQLEKRGIVMGDRTPGMVMEAQRYGHILGGTGFGASITVANLIMADGNSLENIGVVPDELVLPTVEDIVNNRDPVLARAAEAAGATLSAKDAAGLFPHEWPEPFSFAGH